MAVAERSVGPEPESIATPIKVVLVGAVLALVEGVYDIVNAEAYAGVVDGVEVTAADVVLFTAIAMAVAVAALFYAYRVRYDPPRRAYLVLGGLGVATFVVGGLFAAVVVLLGAAIGYWEARRRPVARR